MGLTGFNRQRKRALSKELKIDERLADKLLAYGYSSPEQVRSTKEFPFLSDEEKSQLSGKRLKKAQAELEEKPEPVEGSEGESDSEPGQEPSFQEEKQGEGLKNAEESDVATGEELDEEFLALPEDTVFPYKINLGWHYLSNGEKVNGKAKAEQAQAELDGE